MTAPHDEVARLRELCDELLRRAEAEPRQAARLTARVEKLLAPPSKRASGGRGNRRAQPVLDPFEIHRADPESLPARLRELDLEQLRDVVAHQGMDPRRLVMKWKDRERVIAHIDGTVRTRSRKGEAFRSPSRPAG